MLALYLVTTGNNNTVYWRKKQLATWTIVEQPTIQSALAMQAGADGMLNITSDSNELMCW